MFVLTRFYCKRNEDSGDKSISYPEATLGSVDTQRRDVQIRHTVAANRNTVRKPFRPIAQDTGKAAVVNPIHPQFASSAMLPSDQPKA